MFYFYLMFYFQKMIEILKVLGGYALFLTISGTFANLLIFFTTLKFKDDISFKIIGFNALSDAFALYYWNLNHYLTSIHDFDLQNFNIYTCKIGIFIQFTSLQFSAWSYVRFLKIIYKLFINFCSNKEKFTREIVIYILRF